MLVLQDARAVIMITVRVLGLVLWFGLGTVSVYAEESGPPSSDWHYGGFVDLSYAVDFNFPSNHEFRSRGTTSRVDELAPNMGFVYVRKDVSPESRWGGEFAGQGGYDTKTFAYGQDRPLLGSADTLRHFGRANVSYLAPVGQGLTVTAGVFGSFIGYESLYARDNFNYSRTWIADNSPYTMFGVGARYPVRDDLTAGLFVINKYWYLTNPNNLPSYGGLLSWKATPRITVTENIYYGPDQANTALEFWRLFSNSIIEWKAEDVTVALSYDFGTENMTQPGSPRAFWTGGALFTRWHVAGPWSVAFRPEFYWDRNGRQTGFVQFVKAFTSTLEYKLPWQKTTTLLRLEHRYDESTGRQGGFFKNGNFANGQPMLTPGQHLLFLALIWSFDS